MIVAIDGLDGSGKETTCRELANMLVERNIVHKDFVKVHSFPDYTIPSGKEIKRVLSGDLLAGTPKQAKALMIATLFAYNRAEHFVRTNFKDDSANQQCVHIFDRYWASNILYQGIGLSGEDLNTFAGYCKNMDMQLGNPMPDVYYFLHLPYSILSKHLQGRESKSGVTDTYEEDTFQMCVYHLSEYIISEGKNYPNLDIYDKVIECASKTKTVGTGITLDNWYQESVSCIVQNIYENLRDYAGAFSK